MILDLDLPRAGHVTYAVSIVDTIYTEETSSVVLSREPPRQMAQGDEMRRLELMSCVVAGLFTRPERYAELNRRLEHALGDAAEVKPRSFRSPWDAKGRRRPV